MIVKMKKVMLVCLAGDRKATLDNLRDLGLMHLVSVKEPRSDDLDTARSRVQRAESAISLLDGLKTDGDGRPSSGQNLSPESAVKSVHQLSERQKTLAETLSALRTERVRLEPYGDYDPATISRLRTRGVYIKLFSAPAKEVVSAPDGVDLFQIGHDSSSQYFALVSKEEFTCEAYQEIQPPAQSLSAVDHNITLVQKELEEVRSELQSLTEYRDGIAGSLDALVENVEYAEANDGMGATENLAYLQGFCPIDRVDALRKRAARKGWGLVVRDPSDEEQPPTLVNYPRWVKPIKAVFDALGILPGYREADISMVFLLFFSVFFAMLIGDAGYGILFLILTLYARRKMKKAPAYPFVLFGVLSVCTFVWGVLTGNYFGISSEVLPGPLQSLMLPWLTNPDTARDNVIKLCFFIGATHLTVAHVWNAVVVFPDKKWLAQFGWIGLVWSMFFAAGHYVLGYDYPSWLRWVFIPSLILVALFMTSRKEMKTEWIHHAMLPLSVINCFVDVISYIRLFAVGMASAKVAMSVNMVVGLGVSKIWTIPIIAAILLAGHALNIALCALGILVHGVRLNTLEFSLHRDMQWSGFAYKPFSKRTRTQEA